MKIKQKIGEIASNVVLHWKTPAAGNYMNYKEIISYAGGGIGAYFIITIIQAMSLSVGNTLICNSIGIKPTHTYILYVIAILSSFPFTAIRANIIDNTRSKKGKYRPYLVTMGIPTVILALAFVWMPYEHMSYIAKCLAILFINFGFQFFYMFFFEAYENLILVLSPNTQERTNVSAVKAVVQSMAPSIMGIVMPLAAKFLTNGDMTNLRLYRWTYPPMLIGGMLIAILVYANTQEKIVQAKTHIVQIKFIDALRAVGKNKYFWIISLAGWLGFLEGSYGTILYWLYQYQRACTEGQYALITTIYGNASLWGMLLAPWAIKKYGKKKVLCVTNFMNIIFIALMYPIIIKADPAYCIWIILICLWMNALVGSFAHILNPSINGDIRDYQQYITGERIDGMFSTVGLIGSVITLCTSGILPVVYEKCGINERVLSQRLNEIISIAGPERVSAASAKVYDVLYIREIFDSTIVFLIALSVIGAIMNLIPYFFYDLSEIKQRGMIAVLKVRALFEDYGNNALKDEELVATIDLVEHAKEMVNEKERPVSKDIIKEAKENAKKLDKASSKAVIKAAKKQLRENKEFNDDIYISRYVVNEMNKFNRPFGIRQYEMCKATAAEGYVGVRGYDLTKLRTELSEAKKLPKNTEEEKEYRKFEIDAINDKILSKKYMDKYYPDSEPVKPNNEEFVKNCNLYEEKEEQIAAVYVDKSAFKKEKNEAKVKESEQKIKQLKIEMNELDKQIKEYMNEECRYNRATKAYYSATRVLTQYENYQHFNDIADMYEESKARAAEAAKQKEDEAARLAEEEKALAEKIKQEKLQKKLENASEKKQTKILEKENAKSEKKDLKEKKKSQPEAAKAPVEKKKAKADGKKQTDKKKKDK